MLFRSSICISWQAGRNTHHPQLAPKPAGTLSAALRCRKLRARRASPSASMPPGAPASQSAAAAGKEASKNAAFGGDGPGNDLVGLRPSKKMKKDRFVYPDAPWLSMLLMLDAMGYEEHKA